MNRAIRSDSIEAHLKQANSQLQLESGRLWVERDIERINYA